MVAGEILPGDIETEEKFPVFRGSIATERTYEKIEIIDIDFVIPTIISRDVLVGIKGMKMIVPSWKTEKLWEDLHVAHRLRVIVSVVLLIIGIVDLSLNLLHFPAISDSFSDILWLIGSLGLLGTSTYLALDDKRD